MLIRVFGSTPARRGAFAAAPFVWLFGIALLTFYFRRDNHGFFVA